MLQRLQKRNARVLVAGVASFALVLGILIVLGVSSASAQGPATGTPAPGCNFSGPMMGRGMMGGMSGGRGGMMVQQFTPEQCAQMDHMMNMMGGPMMGRGGMGGMMGGMMQNMPMDQFGPGTGMMGAWTPPADLRPAAGKPLTLDAAAKVAEAYIAAWKSERKLKLGHVMQFSDNFYAQAVEVDTKRGAFEFLIDPETATVFGEPGPNMMWNLRYGMMGGSMGMWRSGQSADQGDKLTVTPEKAREYAQAFLDRVFAGAKVTTDITTFYGYYTLDFSRDGKVIGMLSVNGFTGQVWYHHWHGDFVAETH